MPVITITNTKGGTGKTSTCFHLAGYWAHVGLKVLIIDADPQGSITSGYWGQNALDQIPLEETIHELFTGDPPAEQIVHMTPFEGISIVPAHEEMETWMVPLRHHEDWWGRMGSSIKQLTDKVHNQYDYIMVDSPPNLSLLTHASLMAADFVIIPVQPEDFGARGVQRVNKSIARVQEIHQTPYLLGYLQLMTQKTKDTHKLYDKRIRSEFEEQVFNTTVPDAHDFVKSLLTRKSLAQINKSGVAFKSMKSLAGEIGERIAMARQPLEAVA